MSQKYREVVVEGPSGWTFGFVEGFLAAGNENHAVFDAEREGFDVESLREHIREMLFRDRETSHILVSPSAVDAVKAALTAAAGRVETLEVRSERDVDAAEFEFSLRIHSEDKAREIRDWFRDADSHGAVEVDATFEESRDPDAKGAEAYAPAHDFELRAAGTVRGDVATVIALYRLCGNEELVAQRAMKLVVS